MKHIVALTLLAAGCTQPPPDLTSIHARLDDADRRLATLDDRMTALAESLAPIAAWVQAEQAKPSLPPPALPRAGEGPGDDGDERDADADNAGNRGLLATITCTDDSDAQRTCTWPKADFEAVLGDASTLTRAARVVPSHAEGVPQGFKLYGIRRNTPFEVLGIRNGDLVSAVNGMAMTSIDEVMAIYGKLRGADEVSISVTRRGKPWTLVIKLS